MALILSVSYKKVKVPRTLYDGKHYIVIQTVRDLCTVTAVLKLN